MRVLVVAAHPDDEVLGAGGTVLRHALAGDWVGSVIVAEGATSRTDRSTEALADEMAALIQAGRRAAAELRAQAPITLGLPDNRLDSLPLLRVVQAIEAVVREFQPEVIYTHHRGDLNVDHRIVHDAVRTAARPLPGSSIRAVYGFETVSSTEWGAEPFQPQRFVDVAATLTGKLRALAHYGSEMRPAPHARSVAAIEALAKCRGASVGMEAAEAFTVVMELDRGGPA
jgi:LmbE family N-acetylglucosaminyl deacetylase